MISMTVVTLLVDLWALLMHSDTSDIDSSGVADPTVDPGLDFSIERTCCASRHRTRTESYTALSRVVHTGAVHPENSHKTFCAFHW